jgi:hypothetical protein
VFSEVGKWVRGFLGVSCRRSRRRWIPVAKQESFWDRLIGGTGGGPDSEREEKVLQYIIHRLNEDASLQEVLQEEYVRRNCTQPEIEEILTNPELVRAAREQMEGAFESGELDPGGR